MRRPRALRPYPARTGVRDTVPSMSDLTLADHARDLEMSVQRVVAINDEVQEAIANGDLDGAVLVLGVSGAKFTDVTASAAALQKRLIDDGADWERARDRGLE